MGISPSLRQVFLLQCIDNGLALLLSSAILACGLSVFDGDVARLAQDAGAGFWLGLVGLFAFTGVLVRLAPIAVRTAEGGATAGGHLFGLHANLRGSVGLSALRLLIESLHLACPALWALDLLARQLDFPLGLRYAYSYESDPGLG